MQMQRQMVQQAQAQMFGASQLGRANNRIMETLYDCTAADGQFTAELLLDLVIELMSHKSETASGTLRSLADAAAVHVERAS